jgi:hypothetical protein
VLVADPLGVENDFVQVEERQAYGAHVSHGLRGLDGKLG